MLQQLYEVDSRTDPHRGAIYEYRPIPWLEPPLFLLRNLRFGNPGHAAVYRGDAVGDAFRRDDQERQEHIIASAKVRFVVVISSDVEAGRSELRSVLIVPAYTFRAKSPSAFISQVKQCVSPYAFYLPEDPDHPDFAECYLDFRKVQPLHKGFLNDGKLNCCLAPMVVKAVLHRYRQYLLIR